VSAAATGPRLRLGPSILTIDFGNLEASIRSVAEVVDLFHLDVMDGHYVPNLTFGASIVEAVRRACDLPLHVHLMIQAPDKFAPDFVRAGADRVSFHPEVVDEPAEVIETIRSAGAGAGIAVHPDVDLEAARPYVADLEVVLMMSVRPGWGGQAFLPEVLPKIEAAATMVRETGASADVEVDGGVNLSTVDRVVEAGATVIVAGSAVYDGVDPRAAAGRLRTRLDSLTGGAGRA
jgi:ribulose-phosphate 3-epimerase